MKTARHRAVEFIEASKCYGTDFGPCEIMHVDALERSFKEMEADILSRDSHHNPEAVGDSIN